MMNGQKLFKSENFQMKQAYKNIIYLALFAHFLYAFISLHLDSSILFIYNIISFLFYIFMLYLISKDYYKIVVSSIHVEVACFVCLTTYMLGWDAGFPIYLIALATLVYFCPFQHKFIPYLFSLVELVIFMLLKGFDIADYQSVIYLTKLEGDILHVMNSLGSFAIIIFAAWISKVSAIVVKRELIDDNIHLEKMINHDQLTGLVTRRYLLDKFKNFDFKNRKLAIAIADIDDFKNINDTYGHGCGDYVLKQIGKMMRTEFDSSVDICRWGGEEFLFVFYDIDYQQAIQQMENFNAIMNESVFYYRDHSFAITFTIGLSENMKIKDINEIIEIADQRLYYGKKSGKNQTIFGDKEE